jgi:hydrogenase maturation protease
MRKDEQTANAPIAMMVARPSSTLIIGLGNPILGDDGVGWKVVEELSTQFGVPLGEEFQTLNVERLTFDCASLGGLSLMERMLGYERVVLIDSLETGQNPVGTVRVFPLDSLTDPTAGHSASAHDTTLMTALKTAQAMGLSVPTSVDVVAIEAKNVYDFSEDLSPAVAKAVPLTVQAVINLLNKENP